MADDDWDFESGVYSVYDVDTRQYARSLLTGDRARDDRNVSILLATVNAANSAVDAEEITKRFVDMLVMLTRADRGLLLRARQGELSLAVIRARGGGDLPETEDYSHSIPKQVLESGVSVCIVDAQAPTRSGVGASVSDLDLRTVMCAPLRVRDETLGVMYVDSKLANREFTDEDLGFFEAVCQQMAVTMENARLSQALIRADRMATVGQMTSMIMHDLGGPMTVLSNYADMIALHEEASEDIREMATEMRRSSASAMAMLRSVLDFVRGSSSCELKPHSLAGLTRVLFAQRVDEMSKRLIRLVLDMPWRGLVRMDPFRIERVLNNLLDNAIEAMPDGGELAVTNRLTSGGRVELRVADTGRGIPPDQIGTIFEPFVTHGKKRGTGLGLAIVRQIVESHGGSITCESEVGRGTCFTILLPVSSD